MCVVWADEARHTTHIVPLFRGTTWIVPLKASQRASVITDRRRGVPSIFQHA